MPSRRLITYVSLAAPMSLALMALGWLKTRSAAAAFVARPLLSGAELNFYKRLRHALPEYQVLPQVSLAALLRPIQARRGARTVQDRVARLRVTFVVAARTDLSVLALVELDDRSRPDEAGPERDRLAAAAGYKTHRFSCAGSASPLAIRAQLLGPPTAEIVPLPRPASPDR